MKTFHSSPNESLSPLTLGMALSVAWQKDIAYDPETRDFAMYLDSELVGFARTYQEAESTLDELIAELSAQRAE
jgi:hypothetical protein